MILGSDRLGSAPRDPLEVCCRVAGSTIRTVLPCMRILMTIDATFAEHREPKVRWLGRHLLPLGHAQGPTLLALGTMAV